MKRCIASFFICLVFGSVAPKVSAHAGGLPYVIINNEYSQTNPMSNYALPTTIIVGADIATTSAFFVGQTITFAIDEQFFPNPYRTISAPGNPEQLLITAIYQWNFADGTLDAEGQKVTHIYTKPGTYLIDLKVKYPGKNPQFASVNTIQIDIVPSKTYIRPKALIKVNGKEILEPERDYVDIKPGKIILFDASGSTGNITNYLWDFGTDKGAQGKTASHRYGRDEFSPIAVLRVTDDHGLMSDTYAVMNLPFDRPNPLMNLFYTIQDFLANLFQR